jgi:hypothetical protein
MANLLPVALASITHGGEARTAAKPVPLVLGAASNFSQGWNPRTFQAALALPVTRFRDGIRWSDVERSPGSYTFDKSTTNYIEALGKAGAHLTLTVNWGNPLYDGGKTPHSDKALIAFGRFTAEVASRYPAIDTIEVGNEFNGANFVSGPVRAAGLEKRGRYHLAMVRSVVHAMKPVRAHVAVLGGATHSLPAGYIWPILDSGGAKLLDGLAVHPYTTPIDQLAPQIGVLRRNPAANAMPLHVTEFASRDPDRAGDDLLRAYATMASLGVRELDWYPLNERGDGHVPLLRRDLSLTSAGKAFRFIQSKLAGRTALDKSPNPFTFIHAFGRNAWVIWGAERDISIEGGAVSAFDATGSPLAPGGLALSEDRALVLIGKAPLRLGGNVKLGCNPLMADSFHQFAYPRAGEATGRGDAFTRFVKRGGQEIPFGTLPGQQRRGVPWNPYLGRAEMPQLRLSADTMLPAVPGRQGAIVHRYIAPHSASVTLRARFAPTRESRDGITVEISHNGTSIFRQAGTGIMEIDRRLNLRKGDRLAIAVGPNGNAQGDLTHYRIRLFDNGRCASLARELK